MPRPRPVLGGTSERVSSGSGTTGLAARCVGLQARQPVNDWRVLSGRTNTHVAGMEGVAPTCRFDVGTGYGPLLVKPYRYRYPPPGNTGVLPIGKDP